MLTPPCQDGPTGEQRLPNELIDRILRNLKPRPLLRIARVSKLLSAVALPIYFEVYRGSVLRPGGCVTISSSDWREISFFLLSQIIPFKGLRQVTLSFAWDKLERHDDRMGIQDIKMLLKLFRDTNLRVESIILDLDCLVWKDKMDQYPSTPDWEEHFVKMLDLLCFRCRELTILGGVMCRRNVPQLPDPFTAIEWPPSKSCRVGSSPERPATLRKLSIFSDFFIASPHFLTWLCDMPASKTLRTFMVHEEFPALDFLKLPNLTKFVLRSPWERDHLSVFLSKPVHSWITHLSISCYPKDLLWYQRQSIPSLYGKVFSRVKFSNVTHLTSNVEHLAKLLEGKREERITRFPNLQAVCIHHIVHHDLNSGVHDVGFLRAVKSLSTVLSSYDVSVSLSMLEERDFADHRNNTSDHAEQELLSNIMPLAWLYRYQNLLNKIKHVEVVLFDQLKLDAEPPAWLGDLPGLKTLIVNHDILYNSLQDGKPHLQFAEKIQDAFPHIESVKVDGEESVI